MHLNKDEIIDTEVKTLQAAGLHPNVVDCFGYVKTSVRQDEYHTVTRLRVSELLSACWNKWLVMGNLMDRVGSEFV